MLGFRTNKMIIFGRSFTLLVLFALSSVLWASETFKVIQIEGTVKVQRSQKKTWSQLSLGDEIGDNDIVESFFKSKVMLQYGTENIIIIGPNTKALLNVQSLQGNKVSSSATVFAGGMLLKTQEGNPAKIYTSNAIAEIDSGTITTIVENKTGNTGFQVLGGKALVGNVSEQKRMSLNLGLTSIILSGKEPTAPLYITYRHVSVLKHFFGNEYVDRQIELAGIKPTEDNSSIGRLSLSDNVQKNGGLSGGIQKRLFNKNKIFGILLTDEEKHKKILDTINIPERVMSKKVDLLFKSSFAITGAGTYPSFVISPTFHFEKVALGFNVPLAKNYTGRMTMSFSGSDGIIDKIAYFKIGNKSKGKYFYISPIKNLTLGDGLIVDNFTNKNAYVVTRPLGIEFAVKKENLLLDAYIADISSWDVGGIHFSLFPGTTWLGVGYYYDANQYNYKLNNNNSRFIATDTTYNTSYVSPQKSEVPSNSHVYELDFGYTTYLTSELNLKIKFEMARKMAKNGVNGYVLRLPEFVFNVKNFEFGVYYMLEAGKLVSHQFNSMYMSNRVRVAGISNDTVYYETHNNILSPDRRSYGIGLNFKTTLLRGTLIEFGIKHDFLARNVYSVQNPITGEFETDTTSNKLNFDFTLRASMDDRVVRLIKYADVFVTQKQGGYYPKGASYFASWGFEAGFDLLTVPLFFNIAFELGFKFNYLDLFDSYSDLSVTNNNIDQGDVMSEFYIGIRWGFMK